MTTSEVEGRGMGGFNPQMSLKLSGAVQKRPCMSDRSQDISPAKSVVDGIQMSASCFEQTENHAS